MKLNIPITCLYKKQKWKDFTMINNINYYEKVNNIENGVEANTNDIRNAFKYKPK